MSAQFPEIDELVYTGRLGRLIKLLEPHTEAYPMGMLGAYLTMYSVAIGPGVRVAIRNKRDRQPVLINTVICGPSNVARKTTAIDEVRDVFKGVYPEWVENRFKEFVPKSGAGLVDRLAAMAADDPFACAEGVFYNDEFVATIKAANQDQDLGPMMRTIWQGATVTSATASKGVITAERPHVAFLGNAVPEEVLGILRTSKQTAGGTFNRYIWMMVKKARSLPEGGDIPVSDWEEAQAIVKEAVEFGRSQDLVPLSEDAQDLWGRNNDERPDRLYYRLDKLGLSPDGRETLISKMVRPLPTVRRVAALYALTDLSQVVEVEHLRAAEAVVMYSYNSLRYILGDAAMANPTQQEWRLPEGNPDLALPEVKERLREILIKAAPGGMTKTDINQRVGRVRRGGHYDPGAIDNGLAGLNRDYGRPVVMYREVHTGTRGQNPKEYHWFGPMDSAKLDSGRPDPVKVSRVPTQRRPRSVTKPVSRRPAVAPARPGGLFDLGI